MGTFSYMCGLENSTIALSPHAHFERRMGINLLGTVSFCSQCHLLAVSINVTTSMPIPVLSDYLLQSVITHIPTTVPPFICGNQCHHQYAHPGTIRLPVAISHNTYTHHSATFYLWQSITNHRPFSTPTIYLDAGLFLVTF